jgi:hypothetical protein
MTVTPLISGSTYRCELYIILYWNDRILDGDKSLAIHSSNYDQLVYDSVLRIVAS